MKKIIMVALVALALAGCRSSDPVDVRTANRENIAVVVGSGRNLHDAIVTAATRRRWMPNDQGEKTVRCKLLQRENEVVVDVVIVDDRHYSIKFVSANIPDNKYQQWIGMLQREISRSAAVGN